LSTPEAYRERAQKTLDDAERRAGEILEKAGGDALADNDRADELELAARAEERRKELLELAAVESQETLRLQAEAEDASTSADEAAGRRASLEATVAAMEQERARLVAEIDQLTAHGYGEEAIELERTLDELDQTTVREQLATAIAAERDLRETGISAGAASEQHRAAAARLRADAQDTRADLEPEYARRREQRAQARMFELTVFSQRSQFAFMFLTEAARQEAEKQKAAEKPQVFFHLPPNTVPPPR
jgi:hypothetical protein